MSPTLTGSKAPRLRRALGGTNPLSRYPRAYLFLARRRYGSHVLGPDTDIVIEGFPRSANTFAVTAFERRKSGPSPSPTICTRRPTSCVPPRRACR